VDGYLLENVFGLSLNTDTTKLLKPHSHLLTSNHFPEHLKDTIAFIAAPQWMNKGDDGMKSKNACKNPLDQTMKVHPLDYGVAVEVIVWCPDLPPLSPVYHSQGSSPEKPLCIFPGNTTYELKNVTINWAITPYLSVLDNNEEGKVTWRGDNDLKFSPDGSYFTFDQNTTNYNLYSWKVRLNWKRVDSLSSSSFPNEAFVLMETSYSFNSQPTLTPKDVKAYYGLQNSKFDVSTWESSHHQAVIITYICQFFSPYIYTHV
jgi:hypothetical protein